jgi:hypothetical protein
MAAAPVSLVIEGAADAPKVGTIATAMLTNKIVASVTNRLIPAIMAMSMIFFWCCSIAPLPDQVI